VPAEGTSRASRIPAWLSFSWLWLFAALVAESILGYLLGFRETKLIWTVWPFVQALWLRRVFPQSKAIYWYAAPWVSGFLAAFALPALRHQSENVFLTLILLYALVVCIVYVYGTFVFRNEMVAYFR
jgi:hypothetical protein